MRSVRIGSPIVVAVIGAILYFAVPGSIAGIDIKMIGLILMGAAAVWLVLELLLNRPRDRVTSERTTVQDADGTNRDVQREVRQEDI